MEEPTEGMMSGRELNLPREKLYRRRNEDGSWGDSDDRKKSLARDVKQHAKAEKPPPSSVDSGRMRTS